ncbi:hypothetical protein SNEBB_003534 [Seison nebaliae]|nr:hypothetical protein SNEBB_003534 [Seison nebaliae]
MDKIYIDPQSARKMRPEEYPYQPYNARITVCSTVDNRPEEHPTLPSNCVGCCVGIGTLAALQTIPHFMLALFRYYEHKDWQSITEQVRKQVNNPVDDMVSAQKLASDFLAMEILKSWNIKLGECRTLHHGNYLEYFSLIVDKERCSNSSNTVNRMCKKVKDMVITPRYYSQPYRRSYESLAKKNVYSDMSTFLEYLFPGSVSRLLFPDIARRYMRMGSTYDQETGFSFIRPLNMNIKFELTRSLIFYLLVGINRKKFHDLEYYSNAELYQVHLHYLAELLEMLNSKKSLPSIHDQIIRTGVVLTFNHAELEPDTELQNIRLFDDPVIKSKDLVYDVTAILFSIARGCFLLKLPPMTSISFGPLTIEMRDCVNYQMVKLERAYEILEEHYGSRLRDNYMWSKY